VRSENCVQSHRYAIIYVVAYSDRSSIFSDHRIGAVVLLFIAPAMSIIKVAGAACVCEV
jgi:hypothetical protein